MKSQPTRSANLKTSSICSFKSRHPIRLSLFLKSFHYLGMRMTEIEIFCSRLNDCMTQIHFLIGVAPFLRLNLTPSVSWWEFWNSWVNTVSSPMHLTRSDVNLNDGYLSCIFIDSGHVLYRWRRRLQWWRNQSSVLAHCSLQSFLSLCNQCHSASMTLALRKATSLVFLFWSLTSVLVGSPLWRHRTHLPISAYHLIRTVSLISDLRGWKISQLNFSHLWAWVMSCYSISALFGRRPKTMWSQIQLLSGMKCFILCRWHMYTLHLSIRYRFLRGPQCGLS